MLVVGVDPADARALSRTCAVRHLYCFLVFSSNDSHYLNLRIVVLFKFVPTTHENCKCLNLEKHAKPWRGRWALHPGPHGQKWANYPHHSGQVSFLLDYKNHFFKIIRIKKPTVSWSSDWCTQTCRETSVRGTINMKS